MEWTIPWGVKLRIREENNNNSVFCCFLKSYHFLVCFEIGIVYQGGGNCAYNLQMNKPVYVGGGDS
jgi:hypothetical protein